MSSTPIDDLEKQFRSIWEIFEEPDKPGRWRFEVDNPEFQHLYKRLGSPSALPYYHRSLVDYAIALYTITAKRRELISRATKLYTDEKQGQLMPPFNFWRPGWDDLHLLAAKEVVLPITLMARTTTIDFFSKLNFGRSLSAIFRDAQNFDLEALIKLAKLDPTCLAEPSLSRALRTCLLDRGSARKLTLAFEPAPRFWRLDKKKKTLLGASILKNIKYPGSYDVWFDFLTGEGIQHYANPRTFERACRALGLDKKYPTQRKKRD